MTRFLFVITVVHFLNSLETCDLIVVVTFVQSIEMKVDSCQTLSCLALQPPQGPNEFLNVNGPLQVGGSAVSLRGLASAFNWTHKPMDLGYSGCVRNFTFNQKVFILRFSFSLPSLPFHTYVQNFPRNNIPTEAMTIVLFQTYNLGMPSLSKNADPGCNTGMAKAVSFGIDTNFLVAILVCIAILLSKYLYHF